MSTQLKGQLRRALNHLEGILEDPNATHATKSAVSAEWMPKVDALMLELRAGNVGARSTPPADGETYLSGQEVSIGDLMSMSNSPEFNASQQRASWKSASTGRDTGWADAIVKSAHQDGYGFKALVPSGSVVVPSLTAGIVRTADRPRNLLRLVPSQPLRGTDTYSFLRETVRTHAAAPVATSALKPTSVYSVARVDDTVATIAHVSERIPRQTLADAQLMQAYVEGSLREGVELALEDQIVNGTGVGENLLGIDDTPNIQQQVWSTNILITTREALTILETVQISGGAFVWSPPDWETIELFADSTGDFIMGDQIPVNRAQRTLWGQPVVTSTTVDAGKGFLVDFAGSTRLWEREGVRVEWSENTYDSVAVSTDFERNLIRFRAEGRWASPSPARPAWPRSTPRRQLERPLRRDQPPRPAGGRPTAAPGRRGVPHQRGRGAAPGRLDHPEGVSDPRHGFSVENTAQGRTEGRARRELTDVGVNRRPPAAFGRARGGKVSRVLVGPVDAPAPVTLRLRAGRNHGGFSTTDGPGPQ